jgi:microcompartment protein CcmK/EutM
MNLGRVAGTVVSSHIEDTMQGVKLLLVKYIDEKGKETGAQTVAADAMGTGVGEVVLVATGSSARQTNATQNRPCDAVIMAIVDTWSIKDKTIYNKADDK